MHREDIWGIDLIFAAKILRETREALESGGQFKSETAIRQLDNCLAEAERIRTILEARSEKSKEVA